MKTLLLSLLLLTTSASLAVGQDLVAVPVTLKPIILPPPPPVCLVSTQLAADTAADTEEAEPQADAALTILPLPIRCEDGPVTKLLAPANVFYWPPIYRKTCDKLYCQDPPCIARLKVWRIRCVLVYKFIRGCWRKLGFQPIRYQEHLRCGCKECRDISDRKGCVQTTPCPNSSNKASFCYWQGNCKCCVPTPCPYPKVFDKETCSCACPPGSSPVGNKCVGDCSAVSANYCPRVTCRDNKLFNCEVKDYKCTCPSCDKASDVTECRKTVCLEQPLRPRCAYDYSYNRCRCPTCEDQTDKVWCERTNCGPHYQRVCKFDPYWNKCTCPYH